MKQIRFIIAMLPPFLAAIIQFYFWGFISPLIWFLFYPAVFLSAWIGGLVTGLASTCISIFFAFYLFIDPNFQTSFGNPKIFITTGTFLLMGILFSILLGRLRYLNAILSRELRQSNISHMQERQIQEKKFTALIDNSQDVINLYDQKFNLIYLSPSFERVTGFTHKERIESTGLQFVHSDDLEQTKKLMQDTLENPGVSIPFQNRLLHKNGYYIWVEGTVINLLHDVSLNAIVSNFRDITERKKSEEIIIHLALIVENSADAIIGKDLDGFITSWNKSAENLFQYTKEEVIGKSIKVLIPENRYKEEDFILSKIRRGENIPHYETVRIKKDNSLVEISLAVSPIKDSSGKIIGASKFVRDITPRKKAERALLESEAKYRSIMESVADNIVVLDKESRIVYINHVSPELKPEDVHGSSWLDWLHESDKPIALYAIAQAIFQNTPIETEFRAIGHHEVMTPFNVKFAKIPGEAGNIVLVAKDITERKQTELEIHRLNSELEERVVERTRQLAESNKELEAFSYSVSHDLRSPLRAVTGYTNILLEDYLPSLDSDGQRICHIIINEATRMGQLIDDLLSFSRLSRTEMEYTKIDMKAMAQRVFNELVANQANPVEFILGDIPFAEGDTVLIRQVWFNLLSNAIKFISKNKHPRIEVIGEETEKENIYSVADNGAGFDMKYSNKLFGVFQRLHNESEFEGTGVGLAIVKRCVLRNKGRVWAAGEVNKGATLYFALPKPNKAS